MTITQFNLLSFKPVVPLFFIYYSFLNIRPPKLVTKRLSGPYIYISALASAPSRPPNPTLTPQNQASSKKKLVQKSKKLKNPGVLTVNTIPISHKSAKIAIFSCQKNRVPNKKKLELIKIVS